MKYSVILSISCISSLAAAQMWPAPGGGGWGWGPGWAGPECAVRSLSTALSPSKTQLTQEQHNRVPASRQHLAQNQPPGPVNVLPPLHSPAASQPLAPGPRPRSLRPSGLSNHPSAPPGPRARAPRARTGHTDGVARMVMAGIP
jgi:hypothetical protein